MKTTRHGRAKQEWTVGALVNVGFVRGLRVVARVATPRRRAARLLAPHPGGNWPGIPLHAALRSGGSVSTEQEGRTMATQTTTTDRAGKSEIRAAQLRIEALTRQMRDIKAQLDVEWRQYRELMASGSARKGAK